MMTQYDDAIMMGEGRRCLSRRGYLFHSLTMSSMYWYEVKKHTTPSGMIEAHWISSDP